MIKKLLGKKYEINSRKYKKELYVLLYKDFNNIFKTITNVRTFKEKSKTIVEITSNQPGLVIGLRGTFVKRISAELSKNLDEQISIDVKESKTCKNIF